MIGNQLAGMAEGKMEACKPDPEEMLQAARKQMEVCDKAESLLLELNELPMHIDFGGRDVDNFAMALGSIRQRYLTAKQSEKHWLDEIDK